MQQKLKFFRNLQSVNPPVDAAPKILRQIEDAPQAMRVSLQAAGKMKHIVCAQLIGVSEGYMSRLIAGKREMPEWFPAAFCWATGSNLLSQFLALEEALSGHADEQRIERQLAQQIQCRPAVQGFVERRNAA